MIEKAKRESKLGKLKRKPKERGENLGGIEQRGTRVQKEKAHRDHRRERKELHKTYGGMSFKDFLEDYDEV